MIFLSSLGSLMLCFLSLVYELFVIVRCSFGIIGGILQYRFFVLILSLSLSSVSLNDSHAIYLLRC